ncbi:MAG: hypothetical protein V1763_00120 [Parcubacteria group bacterium]
MSKKEISESRVFSVMAWVLVIVVIVGGLLVVCCAVVKNARKHDAIERLSTATNTDIAVSEKGVVYFLKAHHCNLGDSGSSGCLTYIRKAVNGLTDFFSEDYSTAIAYSADDRAVVTFYKTPPSPKK